MPVDNYWFERAMKQAIEKKNTATSKAEPVKKAVAPKLSAAEIQMYVEKIKALVAVQSEPEAKEDSTTRIIKARLEARGIQPNEQ